MHAAKASLAPHCRTANRALLGALGQGIVARLRAWAGCSGFASLPTCPGGGKDAGAPCCPCSVALTQVPTSGRPYQHGTHEVAGTPSSCSRTKQHMPWRDICRVRFPLVVAMSAVEGTPNGRMSIGRGGRGRHKNRWWRRGKEPG